MVTLRKAFVICSFVVLASLLAALGFNTLDWIVWTHTSPSQIWMMAPWLILPIWWAYLLCGILPLFIGGLLAGAAIGLVSSETKTAVQTVYCRLRRLRRLRREANEIS